MDIDGIKEKKPHLKDTLNLYEKVLEFKGLVSAMDRSPVGLRDIAYPPGLISPIFQAFSSIFDVPEDALEHLKETMVLGQIDLTRLPLNETPAFSLPYHEDELAWILFLISKPYFLWLKESCNTGNIFWQEGRCPVCHSTPSIAFFDKDGKRQLYCSFCETTGYYNRLGCPVCLNNNALKMNITTLEGEAGFRIDTCDACGSYVKTIEACLLNDLTPGLADIVSLPLDIVAQGKGFRRHSPNPIGMIRML